MNRTVLPKPPDPDRYLNPREWQKATFQWMSAVKARIETDSTANTSPIAPFVVGTYTAVSTITGTDAASNFVATLVTAMQAQGITASHSQRTS